jgi:Fragile site-associated protein C-terminus.
MASYLFIHHSLGKFVENYGATPFHYANIAMKNGEVRLDYMGSSIVMASLSSFSCKLEDHWLIPEHLVEKSDCKCDYK